MSAAARSFIRADGPDPAAGWSGSSSGSNGRLAALLCFDEMQVTAQQSYLQWYMRLAYNSTPPCVTMYNQGCNIDKGKL